MPIRARLVHHPHMSLRPGVAKAEAPVRGSTGEHRRAQDAAGGGAMTEGAGGCSDVRRVEPLAGRRPIARKYTWIQGGCDRRWALEPWSRRRWPSSGWLRHAKPWRQGGREPGTRHRRCQRRGDVPRLPAPDLVCLQACGLDGLDGGGRGRAVVGRAGAWGRKPAAARAQVPRAPVTPPLCGRVLGHDVVPRVACAAPALAWQGTHAMAANLFLTPGQEPAHPPAHCVSSARFPRFAVSKAAGQSGTA
jgi:hypothetical protein